MAKRKAGVNDIIYELENDDVEISSEDEGKDSKIICLDNNEDETVGRNKTISEGSCVEVVNVDCSDEQICVVSSPNNNENGGKTSPIIEVVDETPLVNVDDDNIVVNSLSPDATNEQSNQNHSKTTIFDEDIVIDSPNSNSDPGVVGCENKIPLVTVRFKDKRIARQYKQKIKAFMVKLIKLHEDEGVCSDVETDLELDIWPEDFPEDVEEKEMEQLDSLFFVDTAPCDQAIEVPRYRQNLELICDKADEEPSAPAPVFRRGPICFNCDGAHPLRECPLPRNNAKIAESRKNMTKVGRYHVEDEQKYGHLVPGRISGALRHALGLKRSELPLHIYRMRLLGYPPGWLEEARISHSGITMFDSSGHAIQDPDEEEGEVSEPGSKDKFDIKKILDFPGFNVPASSRYKEEGDLYGFPPMSDQDSKMTMLQMLAPNAMKAYKRKKLTIFPSASLNNSVQEGQAEMDIDSGEELSFPSVPPLPDEAPPPPPPPPACPPPPEPAPPPPDEPSTDDLQVTVVNDIPLPEDELITIDIDYDDDDVKIISQPENGPSSPSLDDLEDKKRRLLSALQGDNSLADISLKETKDMEDDNKDSTPTNENKKVEICEVNEESQTSKSEIKSKIEDENKMNVSIETEESGLNTDKTNELVIDTAISDIKTDVPLDSPQTSDKHRSDSDSEILKTPRTGYVKTTDYGTPVVNVASPFLKLPSDDKFAKDICDVINFENLPNSTGKYKKICTLLKKVKSEVDRIQDS